MKPFIIIGIALFIYVPSAFAMDWADLWWTSDQQGQRLMDKGEYQLAAGKFTTPDRIGAALFMAGDFETAASVLGRSGSAETAFNRGNAFVMLGDYDAAINAYESALFKRADWSEAQQNLQIATLRKQALAPPEDDFGGTGGMLGADEFVFDQQGQTNNSSGEETIDAADQQLGESEMRALWLRKVETRPADFLAARFNYQLAVRDDPLTESQTNDSNDD